MKPTLGQVFTLSLLGLAVALGGLFYVVFDVSRATTIESSERIRDGASRAVSEQVTSFLAKAPQSVQQFQFALTRGLVDPRDPAAVERTLLATLLGNGDLGEMTLTSGEKIGADADGTIQLAATPRGQLSVWRTTDVNGAERFWSKQVQQAADGKFYESRRELAAGGSSAQPLPGEAAKPDAQVEDPTLHPTFTSPANADNQGQLLWTDLHYSQLDAELPEPQRRVEMSVLQVVTDASGKFAGVLRIGLLAQQLDRAVQLNLAGPGQADPHRIFICDANGHLITQGVRSDRLAEYGEDLRIAEEEVPGIVANALRDPTLRAVNAEAPIKSGHFRAAGAEFLTTFRALPETRGWIVGIAVPRAFYLGKLTAMRNRLLAISFGIIALLVAGGSVILHGVKKAQTQIVRQSLKMKSFDFAPGPTAASFRDVSEVLESLEQAKTAMRALGKYVPIDLVRRLYHEKSEPVLGGEDHDVSLMFTDIKDFTTFSEELAPDQLAAALGRYLELMAGIIQRETGGTIDKYIGDAIMTIWNAPEPVAEHARMACLAALRCREASHELFRSPEWRGLPPFETRFGLHRDTTLVGHFGSPDRMNYTAIGDAVNLASRLESLNKAYGTAIIASERIVEDTREHYDFRLLDYVAVKGKSRAIKIYELLGTKGGTGGQGELVAAYENAFAAYLKRDFAGAIAILERQESDAPSAVLMRRCRKYQLEPPPADWRGIYLAGTK